MGPHLLCSSLFAVAHIFSLCAGAATDLSAPNTQPVVPPVPSLPNVNFTASHNSTRAELLMYKCLETIAREGLQSTENCTGRGPGIYTPPGAARAYAACAVSMFNVWSLHTENVTPIALGDEPLHPRVTGENNTQTSLEESLTHAVFQVLSFLLPNRMQTLEKAFLSAFGINATQNTTFSSRLAYNMTQTYIDNFLRKDRSHQNSCYRDTTNFYPVNDPFDVTNASTILNSRRKVRNVYNWGDVVRPPLRLSKPFLLPHAGMMATYFTNPDMFFPEDDSPEAKLIADKAHYDEQMLELTAMQETLTANNSLNKVIADYWADGPNSILPPGHWILLSMQHVARAKNYSLHQAIKMLAFVAVANYDVVTSCWRQKCSFNTARPATYIPTKFPSVVLTNQYQSPYCPPVNITGSEWLPYQSENFITPPFPEFPSGHSSFSAASAQILAMFTGNSSWPSAPLEITVAKGTSHVEPYCSANGTNVEGKPCKFRSCKIDPSLNSENNFVPKKDATLGPYSTFFDTAKEAGLSRLYGGIHIRNGNMGGLKLGSAVAVKVFEGLCYNHLGATARDCTDM